jgi:hypothetical protein
MKSVSELSKVNNNTMANDYWSLQLGFSRENETTESTMSITFRVTGEIDFEMTSSNDFDTANTILSPTIDLLQSASAAASIQLDFWELINWLYVSFYWTLLADLGQTSPTTHNPFSGTAEHYFSQAIKHSSTNNIFVNNSLFSQYSLYMTNTVMPLLGMPSVLTEFAPLTEQNQLEPVPTTFARSYSCTMRTLRSPQSSPFLSQNMHFSRVHIRFSYLFPVGTRKGEYEEVLTLLDIHTNSSELLRNVRAI